MSQDSLGIDISEKESEEIILNVMKKAKIYQKASHIAVNQIDRFISLFNKTMSKLRMKNFYFNQIKALQKKDFTLKLENLNKS